MLGRNIGTGIKIRLLSGITWANIAKISPAGGPTVTGVYVSTLGGPGSIPCGRYLDRTLGKFSPIYGPHLS